VGIERALVVRVELRVDEEDAELLQSSQDLPLLRSPGLPAEQSP
jgi:hypothetical protein